jgi:hypothetical protein
MNGTHHHIEKGKKITPLIFLKEKDHMTANDTAMVAINTAKNASIVLQEEKMKLSSGKIPYSHIYLF